MQKILGTITALLMAGIVQAQITISGTVTGNDQKPLAGATVVLKSENKKTILQTDENGNYFFTNIPAGTKARITVSHVGESTAEKEITTSGENLRLSFRLEDLSYFLEPLEVTAVRAGDKTPFTRTNLNDSEISSVNTGQDLPYLLNQTPSVYVSSDAGNGVGYTYLHIRGSDATRINVTLNGIPYNDAESEQTYFVDLPDFTSSVNSIQVQRGVGTSTNGSGAFGATINLSTNQFIDSAYASLNNSFGSFNTWKNTVKLGSGLIHDHFTIDARLSSISSDGYIDRAFSKLESFYLSIAYLNKNTSLRFNVLSGKEKTYQAWYGVPQDSLATHRTLNPAGTEKPGTPYNNETDNYWQTHYQLFLDQSINSHLALNIATFLTRGYGYYEEYKASQFYTDYGLPNPVIGNDTLTTTDLIRQLWLDNYFFGQTFSLQYRKKKEAITFGGSWAKYNGKHYGELVWGEAGIPKDAIYYNYPAYKTDVNFYTKWLHEINSSWNLFGDLQYRYVRHEMDGFDGNPDLFITRDFQFLNPKAGISYFHKGWDAYVSYALAHKEPNRDDFQAGLTQQPEPETLHDFEAGISKKNRRFHISGTLYAMIYKNQLVLTGKLNDVGNYTRVNVPNSYRLGMELEGTVIVNKWLRASANLSFSKNKIKEFTEYLDDYDNGGQVAVSHHNTDISFSPSLIGGATLSFYPVRNLELSALSKYVGKQYMDNTQNNARSLGDFYTEDLRGILTVPHLLFHEWQVILQVNNLFNRLYEPNGSTYPYISGGAIVNDNYYYPMARTNFMIALNVNL